MKRFETLQEIWDASESHQISAQQIINKRLFVGGEWQNVEISRALMLEISQEIADLLGGRGTTKEDVKYTLINATPQHWGLGRIFLENYSTLRFSYCGGQDYPAEIKQIRNYLKR